MINVGFYRNIGNNFTTLCQTLHQMDAGIRPTLYIDRNGKQKHTPSQTIGVDSADWIEWLDLPERPRTLGELKRYRRSAIPRRMASNDLNIVSSSDGLIFAHASGRPYVFFATGGDLTRDPFWKNSSHSFRAFIQLVQLRYALRSARLLRISAPLWSPSRIAIEKLRLPTDKLLTRPIITQSINVDVFSPTPDHPQDRAAIAEMRQDHDFVVFHPSRHMWTDPSQTEAGNIKRNDRLIRAFKTFVESRAASKPLLIMLNAGVDAGPSRRLVDDLGLNPQVRWVERMERKELVNYYRGADVIVDQFSVGWFGSITLEGLAVGKPVLDTLDTEVVNRYYRGLPALNISSQEDCAATLEKLCRDPAYRNEVGRAGREFILQNYSDAVVAKNCVTIVEQCLNRSGRDS